MKVFVDTSALLPYLDRNDQQHEAVVSQFVRAIEGDDALLTTNYVALETHALVQKRLGMKALKILETDILPRINLLWIDPNLHQTGVGMVAIANRRSLSLVDCTTFEMMRRERIQTALTLDRHFAEQGFDVLP